MTSVLIGGSACQRMAIMVLITGASVRHLINAEGEEFGKSTNELLMTLQTPPRARAEIMTIKHLIFPMSDSVAFICLNLHVSSCILLSLDLPLYSRLPVSYSSSIHVLSSVCEEQRTMSSGRWRGLLRVSVIFGRDISTAGLNVWCQPIYHPATREGKTEGCKTGCKEWDLKEDEGREKRNCFFQSKVAFVMYSIFQKRFGYSPLNIFLKQYIDFRQL